MGKEQHSLGYLGLFRQRKCLVPSTRSIQGSTSDAAAFILWPHDELQILPRNNTLHTLHWIDWRHTKNIKYTWVTCVCVYRSGTERERGTSPSGTYMNHLHYIIESAKEGGREKKRDALTGMSVLVALLLLPALALPWFTRRLACMLLYLNMFRTKETHIFYFFLQRCLALPQSCRDARLRASHKFTSLPWQGHLAHFTSQCGDNAGFIWGRGAKLEGFGQRKQAPVCGFIKGMLSVLFPC